MNNSHIEWCTKTWNPLSGCLGECQYCYARKIANRFKSKEMTFSLEKDDLFPGIHSGYYNEPFPYGFEPTFYLDRLNEPAKVKKEQNIFVCSMADLFADYIPDWLILQVFESCLEARQHKYLFLTKNPERYIHSSALMPQIDSFWYGQTNTGIGTVQIPYGNVFLSIEPLMTNFRDMGAIQFMKWVIIGKMTGPGSDKHKPQREWISDIIDECRKFNVPVFTKNNLVDIWQDKLIQEYPW